MLDEPRSGGGIRHVADCLQVYFESEQADVPKLTEYASRLGNGAVFKRRVGAALPAPPAPQNLAATASDRTSVDLGWDAAAGTTKYRVEYRSAASTDWTVDDETVTGTTHTVDGLTCGTAYEFRVSAYGDGATYAASWGAATAAVPKSTTACNRAPAFDLASHAFSVIEDAAAGTAVGTVSATDPDPDDTVTYAIATGNADGAFAIDASTGAIAVAGDLDYETTPSYTLTVEASDDNRGTATAEVTITVTDVAETPPAPQNLTAVVNEDGSVTLSWDAPDDDSVTGYQILRRRPTEGEGTLLVYVENTRSTATTFTDTNVTAGVRHVYHQRWRCLCNFN